MSTQLRVALVGISQPGYRSLALDYLEAACDDDRRLAEVTSVRLDLDTSIDPWWVAYRLARYEPAPDVIAMPVYCWTARRVYEAARVVKAVLPRTTIVLGGPEVGPIAEQVLEAQPAVDGVVTGEGEFAFAELLHAYTRGGDPGAVPGVVARVDGAIVRGPERAPVEELDTLPSPFRGRTHPTDGSAYVETYRGCPHRCAYCFEGKGSTRVRSYSWERIADDIAAVAGTPGMRSFSFIDPVFNLTSERLGRLADVLEPYARQGVRLHTIEVDIERIDAEAAVHLRRAGVASVETGPQSIGAAALAACNRSYDPECFAAGVAACREAGISVECDLIIGLPGDTVSDVVAGLDFAISLDPGRVQVSTLHVLPGTELWSRAAELGLTFDPEPPHEIIATRDIGFDELRRLEELGRASMAIYRARIDPTKESTL